MTTLKQKALLLMASLLLLNGAAIYLLQSQRLQQSNQHIRPVTGQLANASLTPQLLTDIQNKLNLAAVTIYEQSSQRTLMQTSKATTGFLELLYPALTGSRPATTRAEGDLPSPARSARSDIGHTQSVLALLTIILAIGGMLYYRRRWYRPSNTGYWTRFNRHTHIPTT